MLVNGLKGEVQDEEFIVAVKRRLREERSHQTHLTTCCGLKLTETTLLLDSDHWSTVNEELPFIPVANFQADFELPVELKGLSDFMITTNK